MRRIAILISVIAVGLLLAFSIGSGVQALGGGGSHNPIASFKNDDKDKDNGNAGGNGNGNGQSDNGQGNGQSDEDHGNGNGQSDEDHGNGGGNADSDDASGNAGSDNGNAGSDNGNSGSNNGNADNANGNDNGNGQSDANDDSGSDDANASADDQGNGNDDQDHGSSNGNGNNSHANGNDDSNDDNGSQDDSGTPTAGGGGKVRICHLTGRDDYPYNLIVVSEHALPAHERHGDFAAPDDAVSSNDCDVVSGGTGTPEAPTTIPNPSEGSPVASPEASRKVLVCHMTSSDDNPVILIEISVNALPAHMRHGDVVAPDGATSSNDCDVLLPGTPVASPVASPVS